MTMEPVVALLRERAARIRALESEALTLLHNQGDKAGYEEKLREKCHILQALEEDVAFALDALDEVDDATADAVAAAMADYGTRAGQALSVGSVFFMSALLYPEEYREGDPNDLERYIATLENS